MAPVLTFDRGTLVLDTPLNVAPSLPGFLWDERSRCFRAPALRYSSFAAGSAVDDRVAAGFGPGTRGWSTPPLRDYQEDALTAFRAFDHRGVVVLPTGSGKTRMAIAALAGAGVASLVLCPTRALLWGWKRELERWYSGAIGVVGDGASTVEGVTLMTFESAYRHMDRLGGRFAAVVVDEVHHFASGIRSEALEMCPAPCRLGLTATPPPRGTAGYERLVELVGPVVCEVAMEALAGTHLADLDVVRLHVRLSADERADYERSFRPFAMLRAAYARANPSTDWWIACARSRGPRRGARPSPDTAGRWSLPRTRGRRRASRPSCSRDMRRIARSSSRRPSPTRFGLDREPRPRHHRRHRASRARGRAGALPRGPRSRDRLASRPERGHRRPRRADRHRARGRARAREHRQRVGRVLRPGPGKRAVVYELVAEGTIDDARARARALPGSDQPSRERTRDPGEAALRGRHGRRPASSLALAPRRSLGPQAARRARWVGRRHGGSGRARRRVTVAWRPSSRGRWRPLVLAKFRRSVVAAAASPPLVRQVVFDEAARPGSTRDGALDRAAATLGIDRVGVLDALYADRPGARRVVPPTSSRRRTRRSSSTT